MHRKYYVGRTEPYFLLFKDVDWILDWLYIGQDNPWIRGATDPPFTLASFCECKDVQELQERIGHGNWCLGNAFFLGDLCFINQVNGGDEWLTIKQNLHFESITFDGIIGEGDFPLLIKRLQDATLIQCKRLEY